MLIDRINENVNSVEPSDQKTTSKKSENFSSVLNSEIKNKNASDLDQIFEAASNRFHISKNLLKAVAKAESNFNANAESGCGAQGVMQLMPGTAKGLGVTDAFDPEQNIMGGAKYLSNLLLKYDGNVRLALAAYNAGPGNVQKYDGIPPFAETQNYVKKVLGYCGENFETDTEINIDSIAGTDTNNSEINSALDMWRFIQDMRMQVTSNAGSSDDIANLVIMNMYQNQLMNHYLLKSITDEEQKEI